MQQKLKFTVDSALLRELGEKLVETVHVALSELVKNSYDADATEVEVIFEENKEGKTRIKIIDNGIGMNFEAVQKYWMRIATANKEEKNVSTVYGRYLTGAKGIGRFSCRRLGTKLTLITKGTEKGNVRGKLKNIQRTKVVFPWTDFEAGTDVTEIECLGERDVISEGYTGTTLIVDGVDDDEWSTRGLNWLKRQLAVLTANRGTRRKGFKEDPGFLIMLTIPDFEGGIRDLRDDLINAGWGTLSAHINGKSQAVCELNALGLGRRNIVSHQRFQHLNDVNLQIGIMVPDRSQMRDKSIISKGSLTEILSSWGGVQVRYRGFRVYPYGNDDWLKIERDRGLRKQSPKGELLAFAESLRGVEAQKSLLNLLGMRNHIGNVEIGSKAIGFEMKASREGFIESPSVNELVEFTRFAIDWATILRDYYIRQENQRIAIRAKEEFERLLEFESEYKGGRIEKGRIVDSALDYISNEVRTVTSTLNPIVRKEVLESLETATEAIRTYNNSVQIELSHFRLIASTSTLLLIFSHEVKSLLGLLEQSKNSLTLIAKKLSGSPQKRVLEITEEFTDLNQRLDGLLKMTSLISSSKTSIAPGSVALKSRVIKAIKVFELITSKYEIKIDYSNVPNNIVIKKILEAELYSILLNVLSNSIKAVIAGGEDKQITIGARTFEGKTIISICDTGVGLDSTRYNEVFIPFVSDPDGRLYNNLEERINPEDSMIVGSGSGLGLGIVKEIVDVHGGSIRFKEPDAPWATELEIILL